MQDFTIYHLLATIACIALFVWLRIRLFGKLNTPAAEPNVHFQNAAPLAPASSAEPAESLQASAEPVAQAK